MCYQRFEYFTCGHSRIFEETCEHAGEYVFWQKIRCPQYHQDTHNPDDEKCGFGKFYCRLEPHGLHLDQIYTGLDDAHKQERHYAAICANMQRHIAALSSNSDPNDITQSQYPGNDALKQAIYSSHFAADRKAEVRRHIERLQRQISCAGKHFKGVSLRGSYSADVVNAPLASPLELSSFPIPPEVVHKNRRESWPVKNAASGRKAVARSHNDSLLHTSNPAAPDCAWHALPRAPFQGSADSLEYSNASIGNHSAWATSSDRRVEIATLAGRALEKNRSEAPNPSAPRIRGRPKARGVGRSGPSRGVRHVERRAEQSQSVRRSSRVRSKPVRYCESPTSSRASLSPSTASADEADIWTTEDHQIVGESDDESSVGKSSRRAADVTEETTHEHQRMATRNAAYGTSGSGRNIAKSTRGTASARQSVANVSQRQLSLQNDARVPASHAPLTMMQPLPNLYPLYAPSVSTSQLTAQSGNIAGFQSKFRISAMPPVEDYGARTRALSTTASQPLMTAQRDIGRYNAACHHPPCQPFLQPNPLFGMSNAQAGAMTSQHVMLQARPGHANPEYIPRGVAISQRLDWPA